MVNKNLTYEQNKELIELEHKYKMEMAKYIRETEKLKNEWELMRGRIKSAEIRKTQQMRYGNGH